MILSSMKYNQNGNCSQKEAMKRMRSKINLGKEQGREGKRRVRKRNEKDGTAEKKKEGERSVVRSHDMMTWEIGDVC